MGVGVDDPDAVHKDGHMTLPEDQIPPFQVPRRHGRAKGPLQV
jgi:hypothetical protein